MMGESLEGSIERIDANLSRVRSGDDLYYCEIRKKLFRYDPLKTDIAVGDRVRFEKLDEEGKGVIEEVLPRRTKLSRRTAMGGKEQIFAANIDQLVTVSEGVEPKIRLNLIDRYLVVAEKHRFDAVVCVNKIDLADEDEFRRKVELYERLSYPVTLVSALYGTNLEELENLLAGKNSILAGHSGVGKSSLINAMIPGADIETKEISRKWKRGKHATTAVSMFHLPFGGYVMDTPGIREFGLWDVKREELAGFFSEFAGLSMNCRFSNCLHISEPDCAVKEAIEEGKIDKRRYKSYLAIYESLPEDRPWA